MSCTCKELKHDKEATAEQVEKDMETNPLSIIWKITYLEKWSEIIMRNKGRMWRLCLGEMVVIRIHCIHELRSTLKSHDCIVSYDFCGWKKNIHNMVDIQWIIVGTINIVYKPKMKLNHKMSKDFPEPVLMGELET